MTTTTISLEDQIRSAYAFLTEGPGDWVPLYELRLALGENVDRAEVDKTLKHMDTLPGVNVNPEENGKAITQDDRDAAVVIGGEANHLIAIS